MSTIPVKTWELILGAAIAIASATLAVGSYRAQVEINSQVSTDNRERIIAIETRQAGYEADIRWIKEALIEIKQELKK
jgi:hypothetical protein